MDLGKGDVPYLAVEAGTRIPSRRLRPVLEKNGDLVAAGLYEVRHIAPE